MKNAAWTRLVGMATVGSVLVGTAGYAEGPQPPTGWYVGAGGGIAFALDDQSFDVEDVTVVELDFDVGWSGVGTAIGYAFRDDWKGWRLDLQPAYSSLTVGSVSAVAAEAGDAELNVFELTGNVLYDFDFKSQFAPYLGVGLGWQRASLKDIAFSGLAAQAGGPAVTVLNDKASNGVIQGIGGLSWWLGETWNLFLEYRYVTGFGDSNFTLENGEDFKGRVATHRGYLGLRWFFGDS
jgi:opacity protein-like surface antigen